MASTHVRLSVETRKRLDNYRMALLERALNEVADVKGVAEWREKGPWLSADAAINHLLNLVDQHRERSRRSGERRKAKRKG